MVAAEAVATVVVVMVVEAVATDGMDAILFQKPLFSNYKNMDLLLKIN